MLKPKNIILHHSFSRDHDRLDWADVYKWHVHENGWVDIGYHWGLEKIGARYQILLGRPLHMHGAHCREQNMNMRSFGLCFIGNFDAVPPKKEQWEVGVNFVADLCITFNIKVGNVYGHRDFATYKSCPGRMFDVGKFRSEVNEKVNNILRILKK